MYDVLDVLTEEEIDKKFDQRWVIALPTDDVTKFKIYGVFDDELDSVRFARKFVEEEGREAMRYQAGAYDYEEDMSPLPRWDGCFTLYDGVTI